MKRNFIGKVCNLDHFLYDRSRLIFWFRSRKISVSIDLLIIGNVKFFDFKLNFFLPDRSSAYALRNGLQNGIRFFHNFFFLNLVYAVLGTNVIISVKINYFFFGV